MSTAASSSPASSGRPGRYQRSFGGLLGAILVLFLAALGWWLLSRVMSQPEPNRVRAVDYSDTLEQARREAPFHVLAPTPAPPGWRATSVAYDVAGPVRTWQLGYHDDGGTQFVGLTQSNGSADDVIDEATPADQPAGSVRVAGRSWMVMSADEETALVAARGAQTVVVTGTVPRDVLVAFVRSLR